MNDMKKAADCFLEAARLIERGALELDAADAPCICCGRAVARRYNHLKAYKIVADLPTKLRGLAAQLPGFANDKPNPGYTDALAAFHAAAQKKTSSDQ